MSAVVERLWRREMLSQLRLLAGRLLVLAIYVGLAFVGIVMLVWGFFFALAVAGGLLILFLLMRLFGVRRPAVRFSRTATPPPYGGTASSADSSGAASKPAGVIDLQRRDDGSYE